MIKKLWAQWASSSKVSAPQLSGHISGAANAMAKTQNGSEAVNVSWGARTKIGTTHQDFVSRASLLPLVPLPTLYSHISRTAALIVEILDNPKIMNTPGDTRARIMSTHRDFMRQASLLPPLPTAFWSHLKNGESYSHKTKWSWALE